MIGREHDYAWMRARQEAQRKLSVPCKRRRRKSKIRHGTLSAYVHWRCRCEKCAEASRENWRERKIRVTPEERLAWGRV